MESHTILPSMAQIPAVQQTAPTVMPALCVPAASTLHKTVLLSKFFPVTTLLNVDQWISSLHNTDFLDHFSHIIHGLQYGFSLGLETFTLDATFSPPDHY